LGPVSSSITADVSAAATSADVKRILDRYAEAGGNHLDLADIYSGGNSETWVGEWLRETKRNREDFVIASKCGLQFGSGVNDVGLSRKHVISSVNATLARLGIDYLDIYYAHTWDKGTRIEELLRTFDYLVRSGKVRYVAASNWTGYQVQRAVDYAKFLGLEPIVALQQQYNLIDRWPEWEQEPVCREDGLAFVAYSPLAVGWLAGKYTRENQPKDASSRAGLETSWGLTSNSAENKGNERTWRIVEVLQQIATETGRTKTQVSFAWLRGRALAIIGPRTLEHLEDALASTTLELTPEQRKRLDEVSALPSMMPYSFIDANASIANRHR